MIGPSVRPRHTGHRLDPTTAVLRFEVADINRVVARSAADADLYGIVLAEHGLPTHWQVLVLSCFAVTEHWSPARLAEETGFATYRSAPAAHILGAGYRLWATETYIDGVPDPRNEVHYDLIVDAGEQLVPDDLNAPAKSQRRTARAQLVPAFETVLALLGDVRAL